jgi:Domain of unknown function (DUF4276)
MFDYFRIDPEWPGRIQVQQQVRKGVILSATQKAEILEAQTHDEIVKSFPEYDSANRFIPYIEMHEFEALLFSDVDILADKTGIEVSKIRGIIEEYDNPEEINDNPAKAPAKRLKSLRSGYRKVAMGKIISEGIGIQTMRRECPHFNDWLRKLEHLT